MASAQQTQTHKERQRKSFRIFFSYFITKLKRKATSIIRSRRWLHSPRSYTELYRLMMKMCFSFLRFYFFEKDKKQETFLRNSFNKWIYFYTLANVERKQKSESNEFCSFLLQNHSGVGCWVFYTRIQYVTLQFPTKFPFSKPPKKRRNDSSFMSLFHDGTFSLLSDFYKNLFLFSLPALIT